MMFIPLSILLPVLASANPVKKRWTAAPYVGETTADSYPPTGTSVDTAEFPPESVVGYPGPTPTGAEPFAIQTAAVDSYSSSQKPAFSWPLMTDGSKDNSSLDITKYWGNLSPAYSVPSEVYGLPDASPLIPEQCYLTQVHILYRHGARYPTSGSAPAEFADKLMYARGNGSWSSWGDLDFLNHWKYSLGAELLSPFGRLQNFELGMEARQLYGGLLNNFTEAGTLPVFRTESQDRMVKTATNFMAGFFGVPEYLEEANLEIMVEANGVNNTGAPYDTCSNANTKLGSLGNAAANAFAQNAFNSTLDRLNSQVQGISFTPTDITSMLQLCSYEVDCIGYSQFCKLFTQEDFENYEYYFDLIFYYNNGVGSPVSAAQGKGLAEEFYSRLTQQRIAVSDSAVNETLDGSSADFPLTQSIYADATHEVVIGDTMSALNLTAVWGTPPDLNQRGDLPYKASRVLPFATHLVLQVMECSNMAPTKQGRFILNDAVIPIDQSYPGCPWNKDGLCPVDTMVAALKNRLSQIDFDHDCFANYTATAGNDYNGRAPQ